MANLDSRIVISGQIPNVDYKYGPYIGTPESVHNTLVLYQYNVEGLTVGIKATANSPIKEYWYVGGAQLQNLVPKQTEAPSQVQADWEEDNPNSPAYINNKPTIPTVPFISTNIDSDATSDTKTASPKAVKTYVDNNKPSIQDNEQGSTAVPLNGTIHVSAVDAQEDEGARVEITPHTGGGIDMTFTLPKGDKGEEGADGQDGAPGHNPCLGVFADQSALEAAHATAEVGDYAYADVTDSTTQTTTKHIFRYNGSAWVDNGEGSPDNQTKFDGGNGPAVGSVKIDDTQLVNPAANALAKAEDVLKLKAKLEDVTADENKSNFTFGNGYINNLGEITGATPDAHAEITLSEGIKCVRFLGLVVSPEANASVKTYSYAFYDVNDEVIEVEKYDRASGTTDKHEYVISVPDNAVKFMCSMGRNNRDSFYCYLQSGSNITDMIDRAYDELKYEDEVTRNNLNWQLYPLGIRTYLYPKTSTHTFETIANLFTVWYKKVKKDELIKIECIRENCDIYFSSSMPDDNVELTSYKIQEGVSVIRCNADGYISFSSYYYSTSKNQSPVYLYTLSPNIDGCIKHIIDVSLTKSRAIDIVVGSDTYGTVVSANTEKWGLSPSIDVSGYAYIGIKVYYTTSAFAYNGRGSMFFDENYVAGENDAECIVGEPISTIYISSGQVKNDVAFFKVPDGAKYFRAFGSINNMVIYGLDYQENSIDPEEITEIVEDTIENFVKEEAATISPKTIFELNPDTEMLQKMVIAKKQYYINGSSGESGRPTLILAHISDVHGHPIQYSRFIEFAEHWKNKGYVNELIDTGDVVTDNYTDGTGWRNAIEGVGDILTVIGNHDTRCDAAEQEAASLTLYDVWQYHGAVSIDPTKRTDAYNLLLAGKVNNWGVTQPSNAAANGLCYYYKDYASQGIRLIALDVMGYNQDQQDWLEARLAEALTLTHHVVIIAHFTGTAMTPLVCNYTSLRLTGSSFNPVMSRYLEVTNPNAIAEAVDTFQTNGGNFIGYITGHYHRDMINVVSGYPKQLVFAVSSGGKSPIRDFTKEVGCKSYDDFQIVSVNTYDKTVRLIKVGADIDYYMRKKDTVCVGYTLVKDDGTEPGSGETSTKVKGIIGADGNIATNASNIATNSDNIATNSDNIATNAGEIADIKAFLASKFPTEFPSEQTGE